MECKLTEKVRRYRSGLVKLKCYTGQKIQQESKGSLQSKTLVSLMADDAWHLKHPIQLNLNYGQ